VILDTQDLPDADLLYSSVCIVGAGAAGISLALEFCGTTTDVLLLESGGLKPEKETQSLYAGSVANERLHSAPDRYRQRRFGGTTTIWGGRCVPFDGIDFESRDYVPNSGWPIAPDALELFYPKANQLCEVGPFAYRTEDAFTVAPKPMLEGFHSSLFSTNTLERISCPTDFGRRYGYRLDSAANVRVLLHANVTHIKLNSAGDRVEELAIRTLAGKSCTIKATHFVLAVGGLEVPRLLLANRDVQPHGIGNQFDVVGRYYMCHLAGTIGRIQIGGSLDNVYHGYDISDEGVYCRRRLALRPEAQRQRRLGNFIARLHHPRITDPAHKNAVLSSLYLAKFLIPYEYARRLYGDDAGHFGKWFKHLANVVTGPAEVAKFAWHMLSDRAFAERKFPSIIIKSKANLFSLDFHSEQVPNPSSRVTLDTNADPFGVPRISIDWRHSDADLATVSGSLALLAQEFRRLQIGTFDYDPATVELEMTRYGAYGGHHIGTVRMGLDPKTSAVDPNCGVHGIQNLYIAGACVFPTSSQANPTLTVIALALRLAEHIKSRLAQ
jgi:choline dehydrogenase-like flavoprotein